MKFLDKVGVTYWTSKLKSYVNTKIEDLKNLLSKDIEKKQDKLTAGDNIQIDSDTISVIENTDKRFVSDSEKSIWNGKQDKLTAGENITITNNKISATDTVYTHPDKHKPSEIETDANNRFVTDKEKNTWTGKQDKLTAGANVTITGTTISAKDTIYDDTALKTRITAVENREDKDTTYTAGANVQISTGNKISATDTKYTAGDNITITDNKISAVDTKYTHPTSHSASMITETTDKKFMTSAEKNKLDGIATNANYYTHPTSHPASMITENSSKRFVSDAEKNTWTGKMPISGGVLENYREKLVTVDASGGSINLSLGNVFQHTPSGNITYSITNAVNGQAHSFTLIINMGATARTLTFPASVKWQGEEIPDLSTAETTYVLTFMTVDGGTTWLGMLGGEFAMRVFYSIYFSSGETVQIYDEVSNTWKLSNQLQLSVPTIFRYKVNAAAVAVRVKVNGTLVNCGDTVFSEGFIKNTEGSFDLRALATCLEMDIEDIVSIQFTGFLD